MARSTIERAFAVARSGEVADVEALKRRLRAEGFRAVDARLSPPHFSHYLEVLCTAASTQPSGHAPAE